MKTSLHHYFSQLPDPRIHRNKKHLLIDIVVLSVIAVICGAESWNSIEIFGNAKKDFLATILKLPKGIPSHDTINRVFSLINPDKFEQLFVQWVQSLIIPTNTLQRDIGISYKKGGRSGRVGIKTDLDYNSKYETMFTQIWSKVVEASLSRGSNNLS